MAIKPRKTVKPRSPVRSAVIARLARRKSFLAASASRMRQLEPMDSEDDNVCYFSEGAASEDVKLFTAVSLTSFSSKSIVRRLFVFPPKTALAQRALILVPLLRFVL